jgi:hypothetical protein
MLFIISDYIQLIVLTMVVASGSYPGNDDIASGLVF